VLTVRSSSRGILTTSTKTKGIAIWQLGNVLPISAGLAISGRPLHGIRHKG
jgi:hypothetical protein